MTFVVSADYTGTGNGDVAIKTHKGTLVALVYARDPPHPAIDMARIIADALNTRLSQIPLVELKRTMEVTQIIDCHECETSEYRLPTLEEAKAAASLLYRCNGYDLSIWTDGVWPSDDLSDAAKAIATAVPA